MTFIGFEQVKQIPEMTLRMTNQEIADHFGIHKETLKLWIQRLKAAGYQMPKRKMGRPFKKVV